jgi:hypothetical protein
MNLLPAHPLSELFPLIKGDEFLDFVEDIRVNGIRDQIVLLDRQILDGRNRYNALRYLAESGEILGEGWGHRKDEAFSPELLEPPQSWFCAFNQAIHGEPLAWVLSKNLKRRHLDESQRGMVAGRLANMRQGERTDLEPSANLQKVSTAEAARQLSVSERTAAAGRKVAQAGIEPLEQAVDDGDLAISVAEKIARLPEAEQPAALEKALPNGHRAIMGSRKEPDDSLDYFPTPPWATRALIERVFRDADLPGFDFNSVWEPACGEGHIAEVLNEYVQDVGATDIHDYGYGQVMNFLGDEPNDLQGYYDWIITNPPFGDASEKFVLRALELARCGIAMFVRLQWLESNGRYERIYKDQPPTLISFFAERVNLCKGRWEPEGSTATAYIWLVWIKGAKPQAPFWIPPNCQKLLTKPDDAERFTQHPVKKSETPSGSITASPPQHVADAGQDGTASASAVDPASSLAPGDPASVEGANGDVCSHAPPASIHVAPLDEACCERVTEVSEPPDLRALSSAERDPDREAGLHGGSLAPDPLELPAFLKRGPDNAPPFAKGAVA